MDYNVNDHNTLRVLTQKNIKTSIDYTFSKKRKLSQSHINHIEENISNNSQVCFIYIDLFNLYGY